MAALHDAQLHVLHAVTPSDEHHVFPGRTPAVDVSQLCADAERELTNSLAGVSLAIAPRVHVVADAPDAAILDSIERFQIELLLMGTLSRTSIAGMLTGNTAERLLPEVSCSVLAVKPSDFKSPILK